MNSGQRFAWQPGVLYMRGNVLETDYEQAYTWAVLAEEQGNDALLKKLTARLINEQELAGSLRARRIQDGFESIPFYNALQGERGQ